MLQRVDAMESELGALVESLRTGANRLTADLTLLTGNMGELRGAATGAAAETAEEAPEPVSAPPPQPESESELRAGRGRARGRGRRRQRGGPPDRAQHGAQRDPARGDRPLPRRELPARGPREAPRRGLRARRLSRSQGSTFAGAWRRYQELALEAFERDREAGRRHTHIVAPPGSGKTLLGVELARRIGAPALVLAPELGHPGAVARGRARLRRGGGGGAGRGGRADLLPHLPVACAGRRPRGGAGGGWRPTAMGGRAGRGDRPDTGGGRRGGRGVDGRGGARRARELARIVASLKREIARRRARAGLRGAAVRGRPRPHRGAPRGRHGHGRPRRVPPPRLAVGLRGARGRGGAGRRPPGRAHGDPARRADGRRGRPVRGAAGPGRLRGPHARGRAGGLPRAVPGAGLADHAAGLRAALAGRARPRASRS